MALGIMFQPVLSVFLFIYRTWIGHSAKTKPRNMFVSFDY